MSEEAERLLFLGDYGGTGDEFKFMAVRLFIFRPDSSLGSASVRFAG